MPNLIVSLDNPLTGGSSSKRPPLTWKKLRRKLIKKLASTIKSIRSFDAKIDLENNLHSINRKMFIEKYGSGADRAMKTIENRCAEALTERG